MLSASDHSAQLRKAVIASTIGTAIEWYDFFIYGIGAGLIFGKLYFPNDEPLTATLAAFGTGGPAPIIATSLFATYQSGYAISIYIAACAVVSLVAAAFKPDYTGQDVSLEYDD
jgi:MFS family permease